MGEIKYTEGYVQQRLSNFIGSNCRYKIGNIYLFGGESDFMVQKQSSQYIYEYEIKISRSDFFADFKKHFKHSILKREDWIVGTRYENKIANYFFYVVPENLIALNEVPHYAGLIYISDGKTKTIKEAPRLHNNRVGEKLLRSLLKNYTYKLSKTFKGE